jgi:hypothetical protein
MVSQVTVITESPGILRPLLKTALRKEVGVVMQGIKRTEERLRTFERQYGMTTAEFERRFGAAELDETLDFIDWLGEIKMLQVLTDQKQALDSARVT